ncbi:MAG: head decoration protein [Halomonas sp.]|nr:head decoration protein [Halomonas sp.]|tara:strand:- start:14810 stop:15163 length:354 start_codon:yes stop_codon:yes gene_type:complete
MAETFTYDNLFAGKIQPVVAGSETITGAALARGTVLGLVTASGKCVAVNDALINGAENVYAVLAEDVDASGGDVEAAVYYTGEFNETAVAFGGDDTVADHKQAARNIGIFFKPVVSA